MSIAFMARYSNQLIVGENILVLFFGGIANVNSDGFVLPGIVHGDYPSPILARDDIDAVSQGERATVFQAL
jgi:hypothetical protein